MTSFARLNSPVRALKSFRRVGTPLTAAVGTPFRGVSAGVAGSYKSYRG